MAKKHWAMSGESKKGATKVSKTFADVGKQHKKAAGALKLKKVVQTGLPLKGTPSVAKAVGQGIGGMTTRKKGWKKPGRRGIMGL